MIADVIYTEPIYKVNIYNNDFVTEQWFEVLSEEDVDKKLSELGFYTGNIRYKNNGWEIDLSFEPVKKPKEKKVYNGYGLVFDHDHVSEVMGSKDTGYSKKKDYQFPCPTGKLAEKATQMGNVLVYQDKDHYSLWCSEKQRLDIIRKKVVEWRRNHQFKLERFI